MTSESTTDAPPTRGEMRAPNINAESPSGPGPPGLPAGGNSEARRPGGARANGRYRGVELASAAPRLGGAPNAAATSEVGQVLSQGQTPPARTRAQGPGAGAKAAAAGGTSRRS